MRLVMYLPQASHSSFSGYEAVFITDNFIPCRQWRRSMPGSGLNVIPPARGSPQPLAAKGVLRIARSLTTSAIECPFSMMELSKSIGSVGRWTPKARPSTGFLLLRSAPSDTMELATTLGFRKKTYTSWHIHEDRKSLERDPVSVRATCRFGAVSVVRGALLVHVQPIAALGHNRNQEVICFPSP